MRGRNASFLGADFSRALKTMIFVLLGGSGAVLGTPGGTSGGQKLKMLSFELFRQVRGRNALFLGADFSRALKTMIFGLLGGQGPFGVPRGVVAGVKN